MTMLILLGPAIEDSASGKDVLEASAMRAALFVAVALYAWATVWALEHWRNPGGFVRCWASLMKKTHDAR